MISVNTEGFTVDMDEWVERAKGKTRQFAIELIQDLNAAVVEATPVKTGFLRGSWYASIGSAVARPGPADPSGGAAVARMNLVGATLDLGQTYFAINGAAYARFVEYGTVHMAPRAFVRGTMSRLPEIAAAAAARVAGR